MDKIKHVNVTLKVLYLLKVCVTAGRIDIASEYGRDVYDNALETLLSNTTSYNDITFLVLGTYTRYPF